MCRIGKVALVKQKIDASTVVSHAVMGIFANGKTIGTKSYLHI